MRNNEKLNNEKLKVKEGKQTKEKNREEAISKTTEIGKN
jgi:hypothetical protein